MVELIPKINSDQTIKVNNFWTRTLTGLVFVLLMVGGILWNLWSFIALFSGIALLALWEFYSLLEQKNDSSAFTPNGFKGVQKIPGMMLAVMLIGASCGKYFIQTNNFLTIPGVQLIILLFPAYLFFKLFSTNSSFKVFSPTLFGILFTIVPFCYLLLYYSSVSYYNSENNARIILGFFILMWSNDTFAYLVGKSLGKTKLFERISPKKTWEGAIGGVICSQGIAYILSMYFTELAPLHWHIMAVIVSVFGTLGDLVESMFKRNLGVKDSGSILPGHGGILDRFDGILFSAPFVITYLTMVR